MASVSPHASLPGPAPPRAAPLRRHVRRLQGPREPAPPPRRAGLVALRRPRDLGGGRDRGGKAPAAAPAVLPPAAPDPPSRERGREPLNPPIPRRRHR